MSNKAISHWFDQRFSAIALIFLSSFSLYKIFSFINSNEPILNIFNMPFSLLLIILFIIIGLYHASLGVEVILEDYVVCSAKRNLINFILKTINLATIGFLIISMFYGYSKTLITDNENSGKIVIENNGESKIDNDQTTDSGQKKIDIDVPKGNNMKNIKS